MSNVKVHPAWAYDLHPDHLVLQNRKEFYVCGCVREVITTYAEGAPRFSYTGLRCDFHASKQE